MLKKISLLLLLISITATAQRQSPAEFLGYEVGTQFTVVLPL